MPDNINIDLVGVWESGSNKYMLVEDGTFAYFLNGVINQKGHWEVDLSTILFIYNGKEKECAYQLSADGLSIDEKLYLKL